MNCKYTESIHVTVTTKLRKRLHCLYKGFDLRIIITPLKLFVKFLRFTREGKASRSLIT